MNAGTETTGRPKPAGQPTRTTTGRLKPAGERPFKPAVAGGRS